MATIPRRLHGPAQLSNAASTKYTTPSLTTTVIRHIHVQNPSGSAVTFTMSLTPDSAPTRIFSALSIPANSERSFWGPYTLVAGEVIQAFAGTTLVLTLTIDGQEIS
jgi:hypothetical protein